MRRRRAARGTSEAYHDRVARKYDAIYDGDAYWKFDREITWNHLKPLLPRDAGARLLDAGGGTGLWGLRLARSGYRVTIADTSAAMLDVAREKIARTASQWPVEVVLSDIADLKEFDAASFEMVVAEGDPISFCREPRAAARALCRVLVPGGVVVASVDGKYAALDHFLEEGDLGALERFLIDGRTEWLAKDARERFPTRAFSPAELRSLFEAAGFHVLSLIGKTVLPIRRLRERLADRETYVRLLHLETRLHAEEALLGQAAHLEIAARRPENVITA
jgi:ubiquinone/menaquinone biosynthesis C-methylase UbiE